MKKLVANTLAIVGGIWAALVGIFLLPSLLALVNDKEHAPVAGQIVTMGVAFAVGLIVFYVGLTLMKTSKSTRPR